MQLYQLIKAFLQDAGAQRKLMDKTLQAYQTDLLQLDTWMTLTYGAELRLEAIQTVHLKSWFASLLLEEQLSLRSISRKMAAVKAAFKFALQNKWVRISVASALTAPRKPGILPSFLDTTQALNLISNADPQDWNSYTVALITELLYATGIRRQELINLSSVHIKTTEIRVLGKGGKMRMVPLHPELGKKLLHYRQQRPAMLSTLFVLKNGKAVNEQWVYRKVKQAVGEVCNLTKKSPHVLRHSFATHLLNAGSELSQVKDLLGHSSLAATQIYTHVSIAQLKAAHNLHPRSRKTDTG